MNNKELVLCDHDQEKIKIFEDTGLNVTINCAECCLIYKITHPAILFGFEKGITEEEKKRILEYVRKNYMPSNPVEITSKIFRAIKNRK